MIGGVANSCGPLRDCNRRDRKRSQRNNGDRNVIEGMHDAERLESRLVKGNRSIEIPDGYEDLVE